MIVVERKVEERHRARETFEEGVAEIVSVQEAEEVFPDDFEDTEPEEVKDVSGINMSAFNLSTVFHSSFTSIDSTLSLVESTLVEFEAENKGKAASKLHEG